MRRFIYRFKPSSSIANMVGIKLHALGCRDYTSSHLAFFIEVMALTALAGIYFKLDVEKLN